MNHEVVIIGGGPSGLCLARYLKMSGHRVLVLDRGKIGSTWRQTPPELSLLSPWWTNTMSLSGLFRFNPFARVRAADYLKHIKDLERCLAVEVKEGFEAVALQSQSDGTWTVVGKHGSAIQANNVVVATGYFSHPFVPGFEKSDGSVPCSHAAEIHDYDVALSNGFGRKILVVGKRVTAGQLMLALHARGCRVQLAVRGPVEFRRGGWFGHLLDQVYFFYETFRIRLQPSVQADSYPPMDGGACRELIESGQVEVVAVPRSIVSGHVHLADGRCVTPDRIILATGYRPALDLLGDVEKSKNGLPNTKRFEIESMPGVFLLGFDNLRNFRSRYLRGIRADAKQLANILCGRLVYEKATKR